MAWPYMADRGRRFTPLSGSCGSQAEKGTDNEVKKITGKQSTQDTEQMRTPWNYEISSELEPILSVQDFNTITGGAYATNPRVESALKAASQVIRNYCGWHISPSLECEAQLTGEGKMIRLQAGYVSAITSITEDGKELTSGQYEWRRDGLIRRAQFKNWSNGWDAIEVEYTAGYDVAAVPDLAEAVAAITAGVLSVSAGVASESADGVSISYSASAASIAASLTIQQKSALDAYKVVNSHAA